MDSRVTGRNNQGGARRVVPVSGLGAGGSTMTITMTYDARCPQLNCPAGSRTTFTYGRASEYDQPDCGLKSVAPGRIATFTYDLGSQQIVDAGSPLTTYTYINTARSGVGTIPHTVHTTGESIRNVSPEDRLVTKVRDLLYGPSCTETPSWWYVWRAIIEDPWFLSQQHEIVERYVHHLHDVDDVNQITRINMAERLQQDPTLGIGPDEPATKLAGQIQLLIIRNLDTWRHKRAREKRRLSGMPIDALAQLSPYSISDILEINAAVDALNSDQHDVFEMRSYRYQRSRVAIELELSVSQVDRRNSAAKEKLRRQLRDYRID